MMNLGEVPLRVARNAPLVLSACLAIACSGTGDDADTEGVDTTEPASGGSVVANASSIFPSGTDDDASLFSETPTNPEDGLMIRTRQSATSKAEVVPDGSDDELIPKGLLQVTAQSNAEIFSWSTGGGNVPDVLMRPTNTHICVLTRVGGNLGGASGVAVHHNNTDVSTRCQSVTENFIVVANPADDTGPTWKLGGCQGSTNSLSAEATCVPGSNFTGDPGTVVSGSRAFTTGALGDIFGTPCPAKRTASMWPGMAVSFLNGVLGEFEGGGEIAQVVPAASPQASAVLSAETHYCDQPMASAWGYSLFVGIPDGQHTTRRTAPIVVSSADGPKTKKLAPTKQALCYLTKVSGDFDGSPERVRIYPQIDSWGTEWWMINVHADRGSAYATAECIPYDQGTIILN